MYTLTIHQPWAWAIAEGHKPIENRPWFTKYRGPMAIHAGLSRKWLDDGRTFLFEASQACDRPAWKMPDEDSLVYGAVVAVVDLVDCVPIAQLATSKDRVIRTFAGGPYCWMLANVRKLPEPIPYRGAQGLWRLPETVVAQLPK